MKDAKNTKKLSSSSGFADIALMLSALRERKKIVSYLPDQGDDDFNFNWDELNLLNGNLSSWISFDLHLFKTPPCLLKSIK